MCVSGVHVSPPRRIVVLVEHGEVEDKTNLLMAKSIVSSDMALYVVHLPPAIVINPESLTLIRWLLTSPSVDVEFGSVTKGLIPDQAA